MSTYHNLCSPDEDDDHNYGDDGNECDDDDAKAYRAIIVTLHELPCDPLTISERSRGLLSITIIRRADEILMERDEYEI